MKWFKKLVVKWVKDDWNNGLLIDEPVCSPKVGSGRSIDAQGFRLNVFKARGGTVIETNVYDSVKDRHHQSLYVVTDDRDLGEELGKIITMENLRA